MWAAPRRRPLERDMEPEIQKTNRRLMRRLFFVAIAMFGFGYALVPLYNVFCEVTGLGGKTGQLSAEATQGLQVDKSRLVTVEFTSSVAQGMPWEFRPAVARVKVHPGEVATTTYYARNTADETIVGNAVPSVAPNGAASYFKKIECFCFSQQVLKGKEEKVMPVRYVVEPGLPPDIKTITLSYTFFNTDKASARRYGGDAQDMADGRRGDAHVHGAAGG